MPKTGKAPAAIVQHPLAPDYVRDDSSLDEEPGPRLPAAQQKPTREAVYLDKDEVLAAALSIGEPTRLPSVMTEEVRAMWQE